MSAILVMGLVALAILTPIALVAFYLMLTIPMRWLGINTREALREISNSEAIFFGLYCVACAIIVGSVFGVALV